VTGRGDEASAADPAAIDRLIHEPSRLLIMTCLAVVESADFLFVQSQTGLTAGNLSSHMTRLEEAGYVVIEKSFEGRKPKTELCLSDAGRRAFERYRDQMQAMLAEGAR
jgi:DNA-binding MarR family transcriptional regulator